MRKQTSALHPTTKATYRNLATWVAQRHQAGDRVIGINGAQGSGKSTLANFLVDELAANHGLRAVAVSIDDFYFSRADRQVLAATVHPLLTSRGVPGTHEVSLGVQCLRALRAGHVCTLPRFDKARDDRLPESVWHRLDAPMDVVLFEGWCVGTLAQDPSALIAPVNALEAREDPDGTWRRHVNTQLAGAYSDWFALLDALVFLRVPAWAQLREWRMQQEQDTAALASHATPLSDPNALERFLAHFERLTRHGLATLPGRCAALLDIDRHHTVTWRDLSSPADPAV